MSDLDKKRDRAAKGGRAARKTNQYPLRKFVGYIDNPNLLPNYHMPVELLECGHWIHKRQDIFGESHATRRRCRKCHEGAPVDVDMTTMEVR
jgi:hypothetical protein